MVIDASFVKRHIKPKADSTLLNMKKADLIEYIRTLEHNYNVAVSFNEQQARNIEAMIKNGDIPQQWISVEDRLPEEEQLVLLLCKVEQARLEKEAELEKQKSFTNEYFRDKELDIQKQAVQSINSSVETIVTSGDGEGYGALVGLDKILDSIG